MRGEPGSWLPYRVVDAFADRLFGGNPAAVVLPTDQALPSALCQAIAAEMNLSETAFPTAPDDRGRRGIRWFTPTTEVTLCGHATLAAAHALFEEGASSPLRFDSASGPLEVHREGGERGAGRDPGEGGTVEDPVEAGTPGVRIRLDFPADPPRPGPPPPGLMEALGCSGDTPFSASARLGIVHLQDATEVRAVRPDWAALGRVPLPVGLLGVSVTAPGEDRSPESGSKGATSADPLAPVDFVSRFFGPWVGVDEDPVTGMAHCALGPYWAKHLGRSELHARQLSRRGGRLRVRIAGDRVHLVGRAVTVARGSLRTA